ETRYLPTSYAVSAVRDGVSRLRSCLVGRRWNPLLVEAALVHSVGLAHQDVRGNLVLGAAELSESCEQYQVVERLFGQRQTERPRLRVVFRSGHSIRLTVLMPL